LFTHTDIYVARTCCWIEQENLLTYLVFHVSLDDSLLLSFSDLTLYFFCKFGIN